jgi:allantoinase
MDAWGGVSGLGLGFSLLWTEITKRNKLKAMGELNGEQIGIESIAKWCCETEGVISSEQSISPSRTLTHLERRFRVEHCKAQMRSPLQITTDALKFKNKVSPYLGKSLRGKVEQTFLRGNLVLKTLPGRTLQSRHPRRSR